MSPERIGPWRILKKLGEGGMGTVFLARHAEDHDRFAAIKALAPALFDNERARARFAREAEVLSRLDHPSLVRFYEFESLSRGCFIVMEYVEGETLADKLLARRGAIPLDELARWFVDALEGLEHAHALGIVHRDFKPANLMITSAGKAKVLDFGIAKLKEAVQLTQQGMTLGTLLYMPKEQVLGKAPDARTDVYAVGVSLYEALTGTLPFRDPDPLKLVLLITEGVPEPPSKRNPDVPASLDAIVLRAMARSPAERFASAEAMARALREALPELASRTAPGTASPADLPFRTTELELADENPVEG